MVHKRIQIYVLLIILAVIVSFPQAVYSAKASYSTFGVQPTKIEFNGNLNKIQEADVQVINFSKHKINVKILFSDFVFTNDPNRLFVFTDHGGELPVSATSYLTVTSNKLQIPPKSRKMIKLIYKPKKGKISTGKYSAALFEVEGKVKKGKTAINIAGRIAATVFIVPNKGSIRRQGHINFFKTKSSLGAKIPPLGFEKAPGFVISYKNTGNTHLNLKGNIFIYNIFGRKIQTIKFPEYEVYPGTTRDIEIPWTAPVNGYFSAQAKVNSFLYDYNKFQNSDRSRFFYIYYLWILIAIGIIVLLILRYFYRKEKRTSRST